MWKNLKGGITILVWKHYEPVQSWCLTKMCRNLALMYMVSKSHQRNKKDNCLINGNQGSKVVKFITHTINIKKLINRNYWMKIIT